MKVGITGAAGRIGRALAEGLSARYVFTLFDIKEIPDEVSPASKKVRLDLSRAEEVRGIFEGLDAVIHLAANASPQAPWESVLANNITATYNVYEEAHRAGVGKVVFASTNHTQHGYTMVGNTMTDDLSYVEKNGPIRIADPPAPDSLYGVSKLFGEDLGRYYSRLFGMRFVALRIGWFAPENVPADMKKLEKPLRDHFLVMYLSKRDLVEAFDRALQAEADCLVAYAVSDNTTRVFDLTETKSSLGFLPQDDSRLFIEETGDISGAI